MKKYLVLLLVLVLGGSALAATAKKASPVVNEKVVIKETTIKVSPVVSNFSRAGKVAVGAAMNFPTVKYHFNDDVAGQVGLMYASGGGASSTALLIKVDYVLTKQVDLQPTLGLFYATNGLSGATGAAGFGLTGGAAKMLTDQFSIGADIILISSSTIANTSYTGLLGWGACGASQSAYLTASYYL